MINLDKVHIGFPVNLDGVECRVTTVSRNPERYVCLNGEPERHSPESPRLEWIPEFWVARTEHEVTKFLSVVTKCEPRLVRPGHVQENGQ